MYCRIIGVCDRKRESGRKNEFLRDSNPRHSAIYGDALLTELRSPASRQCQ